MGRLLAYCERRPFTWGDWILAPGKLGAHFMLRAEGLMAIQLLDRTRLPGWAVNDLIRRLVSPHTGFTEMPDVNPKCLVAEAHQIAALLAKAVPGSTEAQWLAALRQQGFVHVRTVAVNWWEVIAP